MVAVTEGLCDSDLYFLGGGGGEEAKRRPAPRDPLRLLLSLLRTNRVARAHPEGAAVSLPTRFSGNESMATLEVHYVPK